MAKFGHFQNGNTYVITEKQPARPLLNYIWNPRVLAGVNHLGGGIGAYGVRALSYIDPTGKGRCSVIRDGNRYFYVKDKKNGKVFNPGWYPTKTDVEDYSCTHGLGFSNITSTCDGVCASAKIFVNEEDPCEIWTVTLENKSDEEREISVYSFAEFQLEGYNRYSDYNSYVHGEFDEETNSIVCFNLAMERPHEWFNGFMSSNLKPVAFDTSKRAFLGVYGSAFAPEGVAKDKLSNSLAACEQMVGALQHDFTLKASESVSFNVLIGCVDSMDTAKSLAKKIFASGKIESDWNAMISGKKALSEGIFINTPDEKINNFANYWLKHQVALCAEVGRDTGKGFRDQLQDAWAVAAFNKDLSKEKIVETLTYMYQSGKCPRGWLPLDHHIYSDGPTWVAPTINAYIKETGDFDFLKERVKYLDADGLPVKEDTVWEHMLTAARFVATDLGKDGLVKSRHGDWNDSLNMTGLKGEGESVWTSIAAHYALHNMAEIARDIMEDEEVYNEMIELAENLKQAINDKGWDGEWYLAAINDYDEKVGSHTEKEGMIYLNSQTWAILSDVCDDERKMQCINAVDKYLDSDYGPLTLYPTYTKFNDKIGRLTSFIPGIWENGTPYCHGGTFKVVADTLLGRGDKAYETISKILPDAKSNPSDESGCEPYVVTNMYFGPDNPRKGETLFAWVTGTAGWMFRAIVQYILGFHPSYNSFVINPCVPSTWDNVTMTRVFRGDTYNITIKNPNGNQTGVKKLLVDGKEVDGNEVELFGDGDLHEIIVEM